MLSATQEYHHSLPDGEYLSFKQRQELAVRLSDWFGASYRFKVELMGESNFTVKSDVPLNAIEFKMEVVDYLDTGRALVHKVPQPETQTYR